MFWSNRRNVLLVVLCAVMHLHFVASVTSNAQIAALEIIFTSTGGPNWNFVDMNNYIGKYHENFGFPNLTGAPWDFRLDTSNNYALDPCSTGKNFAGVGCQCQVVNGVNTCSIINIGLPGGNLVGKVSDILVALHGLALTFLDLDSNRLSGTLPAALGEFTKLTILDIDNNQITGSIPFSIGELTLLKQLYLFHNHLTGTIPRSIGNLTELVSLSFDTNQLEGRIPLEFSVLTKMSNLFLYGNKLKGPIPDLGRLENLVSLDLSNNALTGTMPSTFSNLHKLTHLIVQKNQLGSGERAFNFLDAGTLTKLEILDMSYNKFAGSIEPVVFALPKLITLFLASNCFSGTLPTNMCAATNLVTLDLSNLGSAESCRRYIWADTPWRSQFNAFVPEEKMEGVFPNCLFELPLVQTIVASGNNFAGTLPTRISPTLKAITMSRNRIEGEISVELATSPNLVQLDLQHNHVRGNLDAFATANENFYTDKGFSLTLIVNHLSGDIPKSLRKIDFINILNGNLFSCSIDRSELPIHNPNSAGYQCDSSEMNNMMYAFGALSLTAMILLAFIRQSAGMRRCFGKFKLWLRIAAGQETLTKVFDATHMMRFSWHLQVQRWFTLMIGGAMVVISIGYFALSGVSDQIVDNSYAFVSTAAYLTGDKSLAVVLTTGILFVCFVWVLIALDERLAPDNPRHDLGGNDDDDDDDYVLKTLSEKVRINVLTMLRLVIVFPVVWGVIIGITISYVEIQVAGQTSRIVQSMLKFSFALFKLVWSFLCTPWFFETEWLHFGIDVKYHDELLRTIFGKRIQLAFLINVVNIFIPIMAALLVDISCVKGVFVQEAAVQSSSLSQGCQTSAAVDGISSAFCTELVISQVETEIKLPYTYAYTCSDSIIRIFVPLYMQMAILLIAKSVAAVAFLCWDTFEADQPIQVAEGKMHKLMHLIRKCMPIEYLTYDNCRRRKHYIDGSGSAFVTLTRNWMTKDFGIHMANILVLLSFGFAAPPLAIMMIVSFIMDSYVYQLIVGRFLEAEVGVILEHKRLTEATDAPFRPDSIFISLWKRDRMQEGIKDMFEPWGAVAALREVEVVCRHVPNSALSLGRFAFIIIPSTLISLLLMDLENNQNLGLVLWGAALAMFVTGIALMLFTLVYKKYGLCSKNTAKEFVQKQLISSFGSKNSSQMGLELPGREMAAYPSSKKDLEIRGSVAVLNPIGQGIL